MNKTIPILQSRPQRDNSTYTRNPTKPVSRRNPPNPCPPYPPYPNELPYPPYPPYPPYDVPYAPYEFPYSLADASRADAARFELSSRCRRSGVDVVPVGLFTVATGAVRAKTETSRAPTRQSHISSVRARRSTSARERENVIERERTSLLARSNRSNASFESFVRFVPVTHPSASIPRPRRPTVSPRSRPPPASPRARSLPFPWPRSTVSAAAAST